jgi:hypothetical protein
MFARMQKRRRGRAGEHRRGARNVLVGRAWISKAASAARRAGAGRRVGPLGTAVGDRGEAAGELGAFFAQAESKLKDSDADPEVFAAADDRATSILQSAIAEAKEQRGEIVRAKRRAPGPQRAFQVEQFDINDPGWATVVREKFYNLGSLGNQDFHPLPTTPDRLGQKGKIAILGDWGTGLYGAPVCAKAIEKIANRDGEFALLLHIGDVYYSGTVNEVKSRFLPYWPTKAGGKSRALNSNHEMYSGGAGYFGVTLPAFRQKSSVIALENEHFLFVGLDTGYREHDLAHGQAEWLEALERRVRGQKRVILFSHHQPYSFSFVESLESSLLLAPGLVSKLRRLLERRCITAWYWGHEHRCVLFDPHPKWRLLGRCIGHSGFPYRRLNAQSTIEKQVNGMSWHRVKGNFGVPSALVLDGPNAYVKGREYDFGPNGFATLEFDGPTLRERIHGADGSVLHEAYVVGPPAAPTRATAGPRRVAKKRRG